MLKIRFWPALTIFIVVVITTAAGFWQLERARQKERLTQTMFQAEHAPMIVLNNKTLKFSDIAYRRVSARGHFMADSVQYLDNRPYNDQPGFYVVMAFKLLDGSTILINRGWIPRHSTDRTQIAPYNTPLEEITIEGIARANLGKTFELGNQLSDAQQKIRQNMDLKSYAKETGLTFRPFVIFQTDNIKDNLMRDWPAPNLGIERHYGYMIQWWGMAIAALAFGIYCACRKKDT